MRFAVSIVVSLLSISAVAQDRPPGWTADCKTGCKVWNEEPQPNESVSWSGPCVGGYAEGGGVVQWFESGKPTGAYEGEMKAGRLEGRGFYRYADGSRFEGEFRDNMLNGKGVYVYSNGNRYIGEFRDDKFEGYGTYSFKDGRVYRGTFHDDRFDGTGVMTFTDGGRYEGEWSGGLPHGRGTLTFSSRTYSGNWNKGCFRQGTTRFPLLTTAEACGFD